MATVTPNTGPVRPWVQAVAISLVSNLTLIGLYRYEESQKPKPPVPAIAAAAVAYDKTLPAAYADAANKVRARQLATKADVLGELRSHAKPLADAQDAGIGSMCDAQGAVSNAEGLAQLLETVAASLKGAR